MKKKDGNTPPWKTPKPKGKGGVKLTDEQKAMARARADANGRRYPNLVDNMWVVKKARKPDDFPF